MQPSSFFLAALAVLSTLAGSAIAQVERTHVQTTGNNYIRVRNVAFARNRPGTSPRTDRHLWADGTFLANFTGRYYSVATTTIGGNSRVGYWAMRVADNTIRCGQASKDSPFVRETSGTKLIPETQVRFEFQFGGLPFFVEGKVYTEMEIDLGYTFTGGSAVTVGKVTARAWGETHGGIDLPLSVLRIIGLHVYNWYYLDLGEREFTGRLDVFANMAVSNIDYHIGEVLLLQMIQWRQFGIVSRNGMVVITNEYHPPFTLADFL